MTGLVYRSPAARSDLIEHYVYFAREAGQGVADRFLDNAETSLALLSDQPMLGASLSLRHPGLSDVRKWHVEAFDNVLIFYVPRQDGVAVLRVLHASRDWWSLLGLN